MELYLHDRVGIKINGVPHGTPDDDGWLVAVPTMHLVDAIAVLRQQYIDGYLNDNDELTIVLPSGEWTYHLRRQHGGDELIIYANQERGKSGRATG